MIEIPQSVLNILEKLDLRNRWQQLFAALQDYWYWRGVATKLGSRRKFKELLDEGALRAHHCIPTVDLDLGKGLKLAERSLDKERPAAIRIHYGGRPVGIVYPQPGAENLRGVHLRPLLANSLAVPLLQALALKGGITESNTIDRTTLSQAIRKRSPWFGPIQPGKMWYEQYSQWSDLEKKSSANARIQEDHWDSITSLEQETAWLADQHLHWKQRAAKCEKSITDDIPSEESNCFFIKKWPTLLRSLCSWKRFGLILDCLALWTAIKLVPGIHAHGSFTNMSFVLICYGMVNTILRPLFVLLSFLAAQFT